MEFTIPVIFLSLFIFSIFIYLSLTVFIESQVISQEPFHLPDPVDYAKVDNAVSPSITSQAAIVMDNASKTVIFSKNPELRFSPASTTKIMTALVALDYYKSQDVLAIKTLDPQSVHVGFFVGEKLTFNDLLYAMLLPSSNDAALAIAQNYPGGEDIFIQKMNEKAKNLHLHNTYFADPVGLTDDQTYTTASDLSRLASIAIENPVFAKIVKTTQANIFDTSGFQFSVKNLNQLLGFDGVDGIKTGYTEGAKEVLVTSVVKNGKKFIIVVMKSDDRFADTRELIRSVIGQTSFLSIHL